MKLKIVLFISGLVILGVFLGYTRYNRLIIELEQPAPVYLKYERIPEPNNVEYPKAQ